MRSAGADTGAATGADTVTPAAGAAAAYVPAAAGTSAEAKTVGRGLCRPGTCSSRTTWKLVPPKPKADTPPRRIPSGPVSLHGRRVVLTLAGVRSQSTFSLGVTKLSEGARTFSWRERTILNMPAVPAEALRWPMFDFTEPRAMLPGLAPAAPKILSMLSSSVASPTRVDVPWASMAVTVAGSSPARSQARATASCWPTGLGAVIPLPLPSEEPPTLRMVA